MNANLDPARRYIERELRLWAEAARNNRVSGERLADFIERKRPEIERQAQRLRDLAPLEATILYP
jgi:biotin operon repressor